MVAKNIRVKSRRIDERRSKERRQIHYQFGSAEWCRMIQQQYLLWPKKDRRESDRRALARRQALRRMMNAKRDGAARQANNLYELLTQEEREMLNELSRFDPEE